jgi:hypothetical protein
MSGPGRDPGLQPERTDLAWQRTALAAAACALLLLHAASRQGWGAAIVPVVLTATASIALTVTGRRRHRQAAARVPARRWHLALVGVLVAAACVSALPIIL